jgi:SAM-dependent methyltransferase
MNPAVARVARSGADYVDLHLHWLTTSLRAAAPRARGQLLDVGCGDRRFEPIFAPFVDRYLGVEHQAVFETTEASRRTAKPDLLYDGKRLPFDDRSFDTVISTEVLEHTPEPPALIAEMARVLKPGGSMIVTAPFAFRLHEEPYDFFRFTPHGLASMLERAGLRVVQVTPFGSVWSVVGHKVNSYFAFRVARLQGLGQALGKGGHEPTRDDKARLWTMPLVVPAMLCIASAARIMDRLARDPTEALGFLVVAERPA